MPGRVLTTLCIVMLLAVVVSWIRSWYGADAIEVKGTHVQLQHACGAFRLTKFDPTYRLPSHLNSNSLIAFRGEPTKHVIALGCDTTWIDYARLSSFEWNYTAAQSPSEQWQLRAAVPHWLVALIVTLPVLGLLIRAAWRRRIKAAGFCISCGYDLRGSRQAGPRRCPECGLEFDNVQDNRLAAP